MPIDFAGVVKSGVGSVRPALEAKEIELQMEIGAKGYVVGDQQRLQQVVWNLLSNAVKFTPPGGRIEVLLTESENRLILEVRDSGVGIKPEFLPFVFDRFRQSDGGATRKIRRTGAGAFHRAPVGDIARRDCAC